MRLRHISSGIRVARTGTADRYDEDDLLPLSALQHLSFCERQWGLIHLENVCQENPLTVEGHYLHERLDSGGTEVRSDVRTVRGLRLRSLMLGLSGNC